MSRKMMTLVQKIEMLDLLKSGVSVTEVGCSYEVNESSVLLSSFINVSIECLIVLIIDTDLYLM